MMDSRGSGRSAGSSAGSWDCSICTYTNTRDAFKCGMCEARKGTSTRKGRQSDDVIAQQQAAAALVAVQRSQDLGHEYGGIVENHSDLRACVPKKKKRRKKSTQEQAAYAVRREDLSALGSAGGPAVPTWPTLTAGLSESPRHAQAKPYPSVNQLRRHRLPLLSNVDRSSTVDTSVTVDGVTVIVTEFLPRPVLAVAPLPAVPRPPAQFKAVGLADARAYAAHKSGGTPPTTASATSLPDVDSKPTNSSAQESDTNRLEADCSLPPSPNDIEKSYGASSPPLEPAAPRSSTCS